MKKLSAVVFTLVLALLLAACSAAAPVSPPDTSAAVQAGPDLPVTPDAAQVTPDGTQQPQEDAASMQAAELRALLADFGEKIQAGSAGSSLKAVAQATRLMDWAMSTGMHEQQIADTVNDYLSTLDDAARGEYFLQINALDSAYQQLLLPGQQDLLESAGCAQSNYPWSDSPIPAAESLMAAFGLRAGSGTTPPPQPVNDIRVYDALCEAYYAALTGQAAPDSLPDGVNPNLNGMYQRGAVGELGYCLMDLNADGVAELLVGPVAENAETYPSTWVFSIYTVVNGQCTAVAQGWERNYYTVCDDGTVVNSSSGGAGASSTVASRLSDGRLVPFYSLICSTAVNAEAPYFTASGGDYSSDPSLWQSVDSDTYFQLLQDCESRALSPEYTPFSALH